MQKKYLLKIVIVVISFLLVGWGSVGHKIINRKTTLSFPAQLNFLLFWSDSLSAHGSDADIRKGWDPNEDVKHFIDIDNYPSFISTGTIKHNIDSLVMQYGYSFVMDQGILPWAIVQTVDSLKRAFVQNNWQKAMLIAADLGHYIGDCHMPLHLTRNYNGQYSGQSGIHSRYESSMINSYQQQISYEGDSVSYISDVQEFAFDMVYSNYRYVDSVLKADLSAKSFSGGSYNSSYYFKLWEITKNFTIGLYKNASYKLACLIYTAWKNAGEPIITNVESYEPALLSFKLEQNYPNPFNPSTIISFSLSIGAKVKLEVFDVTGNIITVLIDEEKSTGRHEAYFDASNYASGIYFYRISSPNFIQTKKMMLIR